MTLNGTPPKPPAPPRRALAPVAELAPARPDFARGDSVELARRLLDDLRGEEPAAVVHDEGAFWRYAARRGVWARVPDEAPFRVVAEYAGCTVPGREGKLRALRISAGDAGGAVRMAAHLAAAPGYFAAARRGVAFANGFATLERGAVALVAHAPEHRARHALDFAYDPGARAARWARFLDEVFTHPAEAAAPAADRPAYAADRAGRGAAAEEWVGAALLGLATRHATSLLLLGDGANGKSVFLEVVRALFPPTSVQAIAPQLWDGFAAAELAGCRLNAVSELPERDILESERFKAIVTGDPVSVARKHERPFTLKAEAGHLFACNRLPGTGDQSAGFWRRFLVLVFERQFGPGERDLGLRDRLVRDELGGIAARVLAAAARLEARGRFAPPASSEQALEDWQRDTDQVRQFVDECTEPSAAARTKPDELYPLYARWARANGFGVFSKNKLCAGLRRLGYARRDTLERWYALAPSAAAHRRYGPPPA